MTPRNIVSVEKLQSDDERGNPSFASRIRFAARLKYRIRGLWFFIDSLFFGRDVHIVMPNGKPVAMRFSHKDRPPSFQDMIDKEIGGYWHEHQPKPGEIHLDIGAQVGSYTLLAMSSGATVYAFEPDGNNRRFLRRNLRTNNFDCPIITSGLWNKHAFLPWRTNTALSSIPGIGMVPDVLPSLDEIEVDTLDVLVKRLSIDRVHVIKMDIEGAELEALEGAAATIKAYKPILLIEAYHIRDGFPTADRVIDLLERMGIPASCIMKTDKSMIVAKDY